MKLIAHLIAFDMRRFRWLLLLWVFIEVTATTLAAWQPALATNQRTFDLVGINTNLLWLAEVLLMIVLVPLVVQSDAVVGTDAFWMVRPIPPRTLLAAKASLLGLAIVVLPIVLEGVVMAAYGVPAGTIGKVAIQNALPQTLSLAIMMAAAAVTPSLARFALLGFGALVGFALFISVVALIETALGSGSTAQSISIWRGTSDATSSLIFIVLGTIAALGMLLVQYSTRSWVRAAVVGILGTIAAFGIGSQWRWPLIQPAAQPPAWARDAAAFRLSSDPGTSRVEGGWRTSRGAMSQREVRARIRVHDLPADWSASVSLESAQLHLDDGRRIDSGPGGPSFALLVGEDWLMGDDVPRRLLDVDRNPTSVSFQSAGAVVLSFEDDELQRLGSGTGRYDGRFSVALTQHRIVTVLPLQAGAVHRQDAHRIEILSLKLDNRGLDVLVRESDASSIFDRAESGSRTYYLRNPQLREATRVSSRWFSTDTPIPRVMPFVLYNDSVSGFEVSAHLVQCDVNAGRDGSSLSIDERWLSGAELVVVRSTYVASVDRTLEIRNFSIDATAGNSAMRVP